MDSQLVFFSTGSIGNMQLVSGLVYRGHTADMVVGMVGWPGSTETVHQSPTQGLSSMAHRMVSSITRELILPQRIFLETV